MTNIEKNNVISEIVSLHNEITGLLKMSLDKAIRIGELLTEQKADLNHGDFIPWIKANLPFTERTAQHYRRRDELKNETVSHLTEAYRQLEAPNKLKILKERLAKLDTIQDGDEAVNECADIVEELRTLTQDAAERLLYAEAELGRLKVVAQKAQKRYERLHQLCESLGDKAISELRQLVKSNGLERVQAQAFKDKVIELSVLENEVVLLGGEVCDKCKQTKTTILELLNKVA